MNVRNSRLNRFLMLWGALICTVAFFADTAEAARVLFLEADPVTPRVKERLSLACRFYGIELGSAINDTKPSEPLVVVVDAAALDTVAADDLPSMTRAVLIAGVDERTAVSALERWGVKSTGLEVRGISNRSNVFMTVSRELAGMTAELTGQELTVDIAKGYQLTAEAAFPIVSYPDGAVLFGIVESTDVPVFVLTDLAVIDPPGSSVRYYDCGFFVEIAPYLMFLRQSFGEQVWHTAGDYANLTIDDPWLCDSYGNLRFSELLREMERADFHTTIAYIPWNYDRKSSCDVVGLFRGHSDRFSLCVHGNNHDHREFYSYNEKPDSNWPARPLVEQEADIRQGLARIERFEQQSGLSVDRVMVFPHDIAPNETLGLLKKYNFKATSNVGNVPLDTPAPNDSLFWLRQVSDRFGGGLPSLDRSEAKNLTQTDIAIDLFLDNPVLIVEHLRFFSDSRAAFNPLARQINSIQPDLQWVGLGALSEHLYLMRREDDGIWAIHAFSPEIVLRNPGSEPRRFRFLKVDDGSTPIREIRLDGRPIDSFQRTATQIRMDLTLAPHEQKRISIVYENDFVAGNETLSKSDFRVNLLRHLSNIRDQYLMAGPLGAFIDRFYYDSDLYRFGLKGLLIVAVLLMTIPVMLFFLVRRIMKKHHE